MMNQIGMNKICLISTVFMYILFNASVLNAADFFQSRTGSVDQKSISLDGASLTFIKEDFDGDLSVGILEQGKIDLRPLYEQEATALEIYLAYEPKEKAPEFLVDAHMKEAELNPLVPIKPRNLTELVANTVSMAPGYYGFNDDTNNCWSWGGVSDYNSVTGNEPGTYNGHNQTQSHAQFENWSMITGSSVLKGKYTSNGIYFDEDAENSDKYYATGFANERAFAICVTHAVVQPNHYPWECNLTDGVSENTVTYSLKLFVESATGATWNSNSIHLEGYGEGARYRSTSNTKRRYEMRVIDQSLKSNACKEHYDLFWRAKTYIGSSAIDELTK